MTSRADCTAVGLTRTTFVPRMPPRSMTTALAVRDPTSQPAAMVVFEVIMKIRETLSFQIARQTRS